MSFPLPELVLPKDVSISERGAGAMPSSIDFPKGHFLIQLELREVDNIKEEFICSCKKAIATVFGDCVSCVKKRWSRGTDESIRLSEPEWWDEKISTRILEEHGPKIKERVIQILTSPQLVNGYIEAILKLEWLRCLAYFTVLSEKYGDEDNLHPVDIFLKAVLFSFGSGVIPRIADIFKVINFQEYAATIQKNWEEDDSSFKFFIMDWLVFHKLIPATERPVLPADFKVKPSYPEFMELVFCSLAQTSFNKSNGHCPIYDHVTFEQFVCTKCKYYYIYSDDLCAYCLAINDKPLIKPTFKEMVLNADIKLSKSERLIYLEQIRFRESKANENVYYWMLMNLLLDQNSMINALFYAADTSDFDEAVQKLTNNGYDLIIAVLFKLVLKLGSIFVPNCNYLLAELECYDPRTKNVKEAWEVRRVDEKLEPLYLQLKYYVDRFLKSINKF